MTFTGCATTQKTAQPDENCIDGSCTLEIENDSENAQEKNAAQNDIQQTEEKITLVFAGDVMAHAPNYRPGKFDRIWRSIEPVVKDSDIAFANIESPVADALPWSTYPQFNMHSEYVEAAIRIGFNAFSLANNHTNDQLLEGIRQTKKYFDNRKEIWSCGLKDKTTDPLGYQVIEKNGFRILFVSITEILNRNDASSYIDYYPPAEKKREKLIGELKELNEKNKCDFFVLSVHTSEPEYFLTVSDERKNFYKNLIEKCGVDIIWANHPHVVKFFEEYEKSDGKKKFIMYANGNTISAQRYAPAFDKPGADWENTGEGLLIRVSLKKTHDGNVFIDKTEPFIITTYITPSKQYVIKKLDDKFLDALDEAEICNWHNYLKERRKIVEERIMEK